jgi:hypothetical protein
MNLPSNYDCNINKLARFSVLRSNRATAINPCTFISINAICMIGNISDAVRYYTVKRLTDFISRCNCNTDFSLFLLGNDLQIQRYIVTAANW